VDADHADVLEEHAVGGDLGDAAAREAEPNPEPYYQAASASVWLPILSVVFCKVIVEATKAMSGPASRSNMGTAVLSRRNG